ncbi:hypothetical protein VTJ04DRAFT_4632 [Mycothermus thermophilus]|uniref:uncharacterized protein n=1 Tax=Humicola insolens TaxID=85995 RepID=UPI00374318D4
MTRTTPVLHIKKRYGEKQVESRIKPPCFFQFSFNKVPSPLGYSPSSYTTRGTTQRSTTIDCLFLTVALTCPNKRILRCGTLCPSRPTGHSPS